MQLKFGNAGRHETMKICAIRRHDICENRQTGIALGVIGARTDRGYAFGELRRCVQRRHLRLASSLSTSSDEQDGGLNRVSFCVAIGIICPTQLEIGSRKKCDTSAASAWPA